MNRKAIFILICVFIAGAICSTLLSQEYEAEEQLIAQDLGESAVLSDPAELEAFVDGIMAVHLRDKNIAGATFSVVKNGEIFLAKGYGYADVENKIPVNPETTSITPSRSW